MPSLEQIHKLLEAEPDDVFLNYSLAMELTKQGSVDQALEAFSRVLELDSTYTAAYYHQAKTCIEAGRHDQARDILATGMSTAKAANDMHAHDEMQDLLDMIP